MDTRNPTPISTRSADADHVGPAAAAIIVQQTAAALGQQSKDGMSFVLVPNGYQFKDITGAVEATRTVPDRKRGTVTLHSIDSLITYAKDQGREANGYLYADMDACTITAVFNDHKFMPPHDGVSPSMDGAGWRDHRAEFKAELTPEAKRWIDNDGRQFGQMEFATFIEDNFADLADEKARSLLEVATTIAASTAINFSSARRLQDGQTQLTYNENIEATAGANATMSIPKTFDLGLRLFKGDKTGYRIAARLKYRLHSGAVKFHYELDRVERALEDAFGGYVTKASESGYTLLLGKPGVAASGG